MLTLYGCHIESKASLIQSAGLKIGKVSMAELPQPLNTCCVSRTGDTKMMKPLLSENLF